MSIPRTKRVTISTMPENQPQLRMPTRISTRNKAARDLI